MPAYLILSLLLTVLPYDSFRKVSLPGEVNLVETVAQDNDGMIWFGTTSGIFYYDGYNAVPVKGAGRTFSIVAMPGGDIALGTDDGIVIMDGGTYEMSRPKGSPKSIRAILSDADSLWLGSFDGLYSYREGRFTAHPGPGNSIIYSLLDTGNQLYIGTYDGLCLYNKQDGTYKEIAIPNPGDRVNTFVNALAENSGKILIGTEDGLFEYDPSYDSIREIPICRNSVKNFGKDRRGNILIGTDNGLYIMGDDGLRHIRHEAGRDDSLGNDIVWSILCDRDGNVWFGTDGEVSMAEEPAPFIPISDITGKNDGNRFNNIIRDSRGRLWLGGTDGLICISEGKTIWHKVDDPAYSIAHNRIRKIYEDRDGDLWICTDGSIHILEGEHWRKINLEDSTAERNANWAYDILQDRQGRMWVATSLGGVLIKDKNSLIAGNHIADSTITLPGGSRGLYAYQLAEDESGDIWCLYYDDGLVHFSGSVPDIGKEIPSYLYSDRRGDIWIGLQGRVIRDDSSVFPLNCEGDILCMADVGDKLWISTSDGFVSLDKQSGETIRLDSGSLPVYSIMEDSSEVILGTTDGILKGDKNLFIPEKQVEPVMLTGVMVGDKRLCCHNGHSIKQTDNLVFGPKVSHLSFELSNLTYGRHRDRILWKLDGIDDNWNSLPAGDNILTFNNLDYGHYTLLAGVRDALGKPSGIMTLHFRIKHPWYLRWWAFLLYILALAGIVAWIINFLNMRNRLKYELAEKNSILDSLASATMMRNTTDVVDMARRCCEDFRESVGDGRQVIFTTEIPSCTINIDEYRVATALENILANASAYSSGDIDINVSQRDGRINISVSDIGPGVSEEDLPHIKERFYRGAVGKSKKKGAGIGLYLADVYTSRNGGTLDITSDFGTRVDMSYPLAAAEKKNRQPSADEQFLTDITSIIQARIEDNTLNVASLCEQAGLGGKLVYRKLKQLTGCTPVEYIRKLRLRRAAELLAEGLYNVSEVMYMTGFTNASYFSKCFQAEYGITPKHYPKTTKTEE